VGGDTNRHDEIRGEMINRKTFLLMVILIFAIVLTACSGNKSVVLDSPTCGTHCWRNITLGRTDIDQATQLLQQMADVDPQSVNRFRKDLVNEEGINASFLGEKEGWIEIIFVEGKAAVMSFYYFEDIPIDAVIRKFGEPKYIDPSALRGDPFTYLTSLFYYPEQGICLFHEYPGVVLGKPKTFLATRATKIRRIWFVDPSISPSQLDNSCISEGQKMESGSVGQEWEGYKAYPIP